jgi:hypothetical protein
VSARQVRHQSALRRPQLVRTPSSLVSYFKGLWSHFRSLLNNTSEPASSYSIAGLTRVPIDSQGPFAGVRRAPRFGPLLKSHA